MKECRICGSMIPYYGDEVCSKCMDEASRRNRKGRNKIQLFDIPKIIPKLPLDKQDK